MDVKERISDGISYIFKELNEAKTNDITQGRRRFLLISLDLYLNALEYLVSNKQSDNTEIYINATEVNVDEIIKSIINKEEIYIGYNIPMLMDADSQNHFKSNISQIRTRLGLKIDKQLPSNIHILIPMNIIQMPEYETIKVTDDESLIDIFDEDFNLNVEVQKRGYDYIESHGIGVVLLAGGGGTRFKNSIEDLHNNPDEVQNKWTIQALEKSGVLEKIDAETAKVVAPMTAVANNSPIQENLESVASIIRDFKPDMPVVIIVGPTTEQVVMELLQKHDSFGIRNIAIRTQGKLPFIDENTLKVININDGILDGANGGGGTLLALGISGLRDISGNVFFEGSAFEWFKALGVQDIIMAQTDDAKDREVYAGFAGVMASCNEQNKKGMVILGADYPNSYKEIVKDGKDTFDADFKIGSVWDFLNADGKKVKTAIVEYNELNDKQKDIVFNVFKGHHKVRVIGNLGSYMLSMELASKIINDNVLPLHFQLGKKENTEDGKHFLVTKFEYFMTDVLEIASLTDNQIGILMVRNTEKFEGHMKYMTIDSLPLKDVYKLAIAQQGKLFKDRCMAKRLGIQMDSNAVVEFSNLANVASVGKGVKIKEDARVFFGGDSNKEHCIRIGDNVVFGGNITVIIEGNKNVVIEDGTCYEIDGVIII